MNFHYFRMFPCRFEKLWIEHTRFDGYENESGDIQAQRFRFEFGMVAFDDGSLFFELSKPFADRRKRKPDRFGKRIAFGATLQLQLKQDRNIDLIKPEVGK